MGAKKIENVRVHMWTKAEMKETERQLKEGGFIVERNGDMLNAYDKNVWGENICILSAIIGFPTNMVTVRLNEEYFDYKNEKN